jgi:hypothetical protein
VRQDLVSYGRMSGSTHGYGGGFYECANLEAAVFEVTAASATDVANKSQNASVSGGNATGVSITTTELRVSLQLSLACQTSVQRPMEVRHRDTLLAEVSSPTRVMPICHVFLRQRPAMLQRAPIPLARSMLLTRPSNEKPTFISSAVVSNNHIS